jgi:hypothetical protein
MVNCVNEERHVTREVNKTQVYPTHNCHKKPGNDPGFLFLFGADCDTFRKTLLALYDKF